MTGGRIPGVPNQPKTPVRGFRLADPLYRRAKELADEFGDSLTDVVRDAFARYIRRRERDLRNRDETKE